MVCRSKTQPLAWASARAETWASLSYSRLGETSTLRKNISSRHCLYMQQPIQRDQITF